MENITKYRLSNKNVYGLNAGMFFTLAVCIPLLMALTLVFEFFAAPFFYAQYVKNNTLAQGEAGSASTEETPVAASIADMERLSDGFTFSISGTVLKYDSVRAKDARYHRITLESGEKVIAHINPTALTAMEQVGIYRLPVGVWLPWTPPEELQTYAALADASHYIDMYGDYIPIIPAADYEHAIAMKLLVWLYPLSLLAFRIAGVRRRRFAPAFFASRDPLLPRNDLECWCAATFAIWSHSFEGMEGFPLITGVRGARKQVKRFRNSLAGQWDIHNRAQGLRTVHELTDRWAGVLDARESGWDLCRATQLLGMMYLVGMLKRDELDREFSRAGRIIRQKFSSWDGLTDSYLRGFHAWAARTGRDAEAELAFRQDIRARLKAQRFSPYSVPWNTDLSWLPGVSGGERTVTKQLLKTYIGDF